jgi:DNA polymerase gamma 1
MVTAPPGYCFVGADVDSEELWIASLVGDAQFKLHGGNAIGFMTLEGTKAAGTEFHSRTAKILGISRNDAKVFNYGRIYGAGQRFATQLLRQFNPNLSDKSAHQTAAKLYAETKGKRTLRRALHERSFWRGGTESLVFNRLEDLAEQERPRTPVLGAGITEALQRRHISRGGFSTSRINWAIQSSGVDYLHLLVVAMDYLVRLCGLRARLAITVHDEIRYLVKEEDRYRAALALQVANVWTRAMFSQQLGIEDLPQACAFFSAVDVDAVLRKEVDMDCVTPSHPRAIPPGESLGIADLLAMGDAASLKVRSATEAEAEGEALPDTARFEYSPRPRVIEGLDGDAGGDEVPAVRAAYLRAQISQDDEELRAVVRDLTAPASGPSHSTSKKSTSTTTGGGQPSVGAAKRGRKAGSGGTKSGGGSAAPPASGDGHLAQWQASHNDPQSIDLMSVQEMWGAQPVGNVWHDHAVERPKKNVWQVGLGAPGWRKPVAAGSARHW